MAVIAWECSRQGKLCLGPDMAQLKAANVHPEASSGGPELKNALLFSLRSLANASEEEVNTFHLHIKVLQTQVIAFTVFINNG